MQSAGKVVEKVGHLKEAKKGAASPVKQGATETPQNLGSSLRRSRFGELDFESFQFGISRFN